MYSETAACMTSEELEVVDYSLDPDFHHDLDLCYALNNCGFEAAEAAVASYYRGDRSNLGLDWFLCS